MKTLIDNKSGSIVLIPQSQADKNLIYHLLNCADISRFSEYMDMEQMIRPHTVTSDLGVPVEEFTGYPADTGYDGRSEYVHTPLGHLQAYNDGAVLPDFESEIQFDIRKTLIGFCRDSY
jgi:hypothetical protein